MPSGNIGTRTLVGDIECPYLYPGTKREQSVLEYCFIASAFGPIGLLWSERGLVRLQLPEADAPSGHRRLLRGIEAVEADPPAGLEASIVKLQRYFRGIEAELADIPVDLNGVPEFFCALYNEMRTLGWARP